MSDTTTEYSLWLTFEEGTTAHRRHRELIDDIAERYDDAPAFEPHVTVVGCIDGERATLEATTRDLASETDRIDATFDQFHCSTTRHQCVFRPVEPSLDLLRLHDAARDALSLPNAAYWPHLSVVYSEMDLEQRVALAASIDGSSLPDRASLASLVLVETTGPVPDWKPVTEIRL